MNKADVISRIAQMESETFSDAWSVSTLEETMCYEYNSIYVLYVIKENGNNTALQENKVRCCPIHSYQNGAVCGYVIANFVAGESELLRIAVDVSCRGRGYGRMLMKYYHEQIRCERYLLEVRAGNRPARTLYEAFGYKEIGIRKNYYLNPREDGIIYERIPN